jgi:hypothetical protein
MLAANTEPATRAIEAAANADGATASVEEGSEALQLYSKKVNRRLLDFVNSRVADAKAEPRPRARRCELDCRWRVELGPIGAEAGEDAKQGRRGNCVCQVGPQLRMELVAKHPNLSLEFWSGDSST